MGYTETCDEDGCPVSGTIPEKHEQVVDGTKLVRTVTDEYESVSLTAQWDEDVEKREKAKHRLEKIKQWEHYCPKHARKRGLL